VVSVEDNLPPSKKDDNANVEDDAEEDGSSVSVDVEDDVEDDESSLSWMLWVFATKIRNNIVVALEVEKCRAVL
jgi:hypothetical protein